MEETIRIENIRVHQHADNWKEAIDIGAQPLLGHGRITADYIREMKESVSRLGPYMVLMPRLALAHAAPGAYVNETDVALTIFDNDILFGSRNDPVRVLLCLACRTRDDHIERISRIARKLMEPDIICALCRCQSAQDVYALMNGPDLPGKEKS